MLLRICSLLVLVSASFAAKLEAPNNALVVHEWGTFTSVAGPDGSAIQWLPFNRPYDLPRFVEHLREATFKSGLRAKIRMETPVLYFYSDRETTVSASVGFPQGLITEWYPSATRAAHGIQWPSVKILPRQKAAEHLPIESAPSHYYAARNTNAATVETTSGSQQQERFLFYRGVANFEPPLAVKLAPDETLITATPGQEISRVILFSNHNGKIAYSIHEHVGGEVSIKNSQPHADDATLRHVFEQILVAEGLFPDEAHAMVETWRDSWFEEGSRVFYIFPRALLDSTLPLSIEPHPAKTVRVFVGRINLHT